MVGARPILELSPSLAPAASSVVMHALERRPEDRFASMDELVAALVPHVVLRARTPPPPPRATPPEAAEARALDTTVTSPPTMGSPPTEPTLPATRVRRVRYAFAIAATLLAGATGFATLRAWSGKPRMEPPPPPAPSAVPGPSPFPASPDATAAEGASDAVADGGPPIVASRRPVHGAPSAPEAGPDGVSDAEIKRIQASVRASLPRYQARFKELCRFDVVIDVDWVSFGRDRTALESLWSNRGIESLVAAFTNVCRDDTGKDDVKAKIRTIRAINVGGKEKVRATVSGGAFVVELDWSSGTPALTADDLAVIITKAI
jgi:hypothetical protein